MKPTENIAHYPRPQLRRAAWQSLDGPWRFTFDDNGDAQSPQELKGWPLTIEVPFAPEAPMSGIGDTRFHPVAWYERDFEVAPTPSQRVLLHFGAVDYSAKVWVNGNFVGEHEGGHSSFHFDITDALNDKGPQKVTVQACDDPHDLAKPRGKQDWQLEPHSIWYPRTTGIWQTVWLEVVASTYLGTIRWTPHMDRWEIGFEAHVNGIIGPDTRLKLTLKVAGQVLACDTYNMSHGEISRHISLSDPGIDDFRNELLWSPEKPTLIGATLELWEGQVCLDQVESYTALRSVVIQKGDLLLNGRPYYLRLVLDQGYWPGSFMTAPHENAFRDDVQLVKSMGFNGVRKHQKIEDPRFLYWADTLGLLVWEEMPSAYRFTHQSVDRLVREWTEIVNRDYSHPCIIVWVPFNESWGVPDLTQRAPHRNYVQALYHLTKTLDPTRPVIGNDGWESAVTDIVGIHDYDNHPQRLLERYGPTIKLNDLLHQRSPAGRMITVEGYSFSDQPVILTEFGGIAYTEPKRVGADKAWGYGSTSTTNDLLRQFADLVLAVHRIELFSGFCYTQFTDTFQEANGLVYANRVPKLPLSDIASIVQGREPLHHTNCVRQLGAEANFEHEI